MKSQIPRFWQNAAIILVIVGVFVLALSGYLGPLLRSASNPVIVIQEWITSRYMAVSDFLTAPRDMASLRTRNSELENEVASLQTQIIELEQQLGETQVLYALLDFARARPENQYVAAAVIGRDPSPFLHYIIIDHGSDDGVLHGMPVVTQAGLVGRVDAVTAGAARVQLITDPGSVINVTLKSLKENAQLVGSLTGELTLELIPQDTPVQTGELILTSGLGGSYPNNILIGQISSVRKLETDLFQTASVQPVVDFRTLQAVLVITNFKTVEIEPLIPNQTP